MKINNRWLGCLFIVLNLFFFTPVFAKQSLVVDTDMGVDDVIALLYLLQNKQVTIPAITIIANSAKQCDAASKQVSELIKLTHHIPVPYACNKAATRLLEITLTQAKKPMDLLAIGPLTNIANVFKQSPLLKNKLHRIYSMGGAIHVPGNLKLLNPESSNTTAEWNMYADSLAAATVFQSGVPIYLIPLDATHQVPIEKSFFVDLKERQTTPAKKFLYQLLNKNHQAIIEKHWDFWDPLAAVFATHNDSVHCQIEKIRIMQFPPNKVGTTVIDAANGNLIYVCDQVNKQQVLNVLKG